MEMLGAQLTLLWGYCGAPTSSVQGKIRAALGAVAKEGQQGETEVLSALGLSPKFLTVSPNRLLVTFITSCPFLVPHAGMPSSCLGRSHSPGDTQHGDILWVAHHRE